MKTFKEIRSIIDSHKNELQQKYYVNKLYVFGSYARNEQNDKSDLDLIVDFKGMAGLMKVTELQYYLDDLLGIKTDVVTRKALKPYMAIHINNEAVAI